MRKGTRGALLVVMAALSLAAGAEPSDPGMIAVTGPSVGTHDPTIAKVGGRYLRFSTGRGVSLAVSDDLTTWTTAGQVFAAPPSWTAERIPGSGDFWAPDVLQRGSEWRLYYSVSTFGSNRSVIGLAVNANLDPVHPDQGWVDRGPVLESFPEDDFNAIDPQIARDPAGRDWLVFGSFWSGIKMRPLDTAGALSPGAAIDLARRPEAPHAVEAPFLFTHAGRFYLLVSFDACCRGKRSTYNLRMGRSDSFQGPYVDRDGVPLLEGGGTLLKGSGERDIGPGHGSIFVEGDQEYLVYHTYDARYGGASRLRIQALEWDDGWPSARSSP